MNFQEIKYIYSRLSDADSKHIYINKLLYTITDDVLFLRKIHDCTDLGKMFLRCMKNIGKRKLLFGAGKYGRTIQACFPEIKWNGFIDNYITGEINGIDIYSPSDLKKSYAGEYIVVSSLVYCDKIVKQLNLLGIPKEKILPLGNLTSRSFIHTKLENPCHI